MLTEQEILDKAISPKFYAKVWVMDAEYNIVIGCPRIQEKDFQMTVVETIKKFGLDLKFYCIDKKTDEKFCWMAVSGVLN